MTMITWITVRVRPDLGLGLVSGLFASMAVAGLALSWWRRFGFIGSSAALVGLFGCACTAIHPWSRIPWSRIASC